MIMIAHIDMAMEVLKHKEYRLCSLEKFEVHKLFYIEELSYEDISEKLNYNERTARR